MFGHKILNADNSCLNGNEKEDNFLLREMITLNLLDLKNDKIKKIKLSMKEKMK